MITHSSTCARCVWPKSYPARLACSERQDKDNLCLTYENQTKQHRHSTELQLPVGHEKITVVLQDLLAVSTKVLLCALHL